MILINYRGKVVAGYWNRLWALCITDNEFEYWWVSMLGSRLLDGCCWIVSARKSVNLKRRKNIIVSIWFLWWARGEARWWPGHRVHDWRGVHSLGGAQVPRPPTRSGKMYLNRKREEIIFPRIPPSLFSGPWWTCCLTERRHRPGGSRRPW